MEKETIIMNYVGVWSWFIISNLFLCTAIILVFSGSEMGNTAFFGAFLIMWAIALYNAYSKKGKLEKELLESVEEPTEETDEQEGRIV